MARLVGHKWDAEDSARLMRALEDALAGAVTVSVSTESLLEPMPFDGNPARYADSGARRMTIEVVYVDPRVVAP